MSTRVLSQRRKKFKIFSISRTSRVAALHVSTDLRRAQELPPEVKNVLVKLLGTRDLLTGPVLRSLVHENLPAVNLSGVIVRDSTVNILQIARKLRSLCIPRNEISTSSKKIHLIQKNIFIDPWFFIQNLSTYFIIFLIWRSLTYHHLVMLMMQCWFQWLTAAHCSVLSNWESAPISQTEVSNISHLNRTMSPSLTSQIRR